MMSLAEAKLATSWWSDSDFGALILACDGIRTDPQDLWLVMCSESECDPTSLNTCPKNCPPGKPIPTVPYANAAGLNQLTRVAAISAGILKESDDFQAWCKKVSATPIAEQLKMAKAYFQSTGWWKAGHRYESALRLYLANAAPSLLFTNLKNGNTPIYSGDAASINAARSSIGGLQAGLNYWRQKPLYEAGVVRLESMYLINKVLTGF